MSCRVPRPGLGLLSVAGCDQAACLWITTCDGCAALGRRWWCCPNWRRRWRPLPTGRRCMAGEQPCGISQRERRGASAHAATRHSGQRPLQRPRKCQRRRRSLRAWPRSQRRRRRHSLRTRRLARYPLRASSSRTSSRCVLPASPQPCHRRLHAPRAAPRAAHCIVSRVHSAHPVC